MLKSATGTAFVDSDELLFAVEPVSFCCAHTGRASRAPIATITIQLRIDSSLENQESRNHLASLLNRVQQTAEWQRRAVRSKPLAYPNWGRYHNNLANNGSSGEIKLVAAGKSIFHKFIILQAFPEMERVVRLIVAPRPFASTGMSYTLSPMAATTLLDLNWTGQARCIATALLRSDRFTALIDPGPGSTLDTLRERLEAHRLRVTDLNAILLTHIHLDHAGATGALVQENPSLHVYVHARGAAHMVDPVKLLDSAGRLYGQEMQKLFGDFLPVPENNLRILQGGETLALGSRELRVIYTPGHASHHVTYFDPTERVAYVGDTAGISIEGHPFILPATPPPDINLELWSESLEAIAQLRPRRLVLIHF